MKQKTLLSTQDAAAKLFISENTFRNIVKRREIEPDEIHKRYGGGEYWLWANKTIGRVARLSDVKKTRSRKAPSPAVSVDLLPAIFTVNRAAKRFRDAAQRHYQGSRHGFARDNRMKKSDLYDLKDRGIAAATLLGLLEFSGFHGGMAIYKGSGCCFHSRLVPLGVEHPIRSANTNIPFFAESKPKEATEPRLMDAKYTLSQLPHLPLHFSSLHSPEKPKSQRVGFAENIDDIEEEDEP